MVTCPLLLENIWHLRRLDYGLKSTRQLLRRDASVLSMVRHWERVLKLPYQGSRHETCNNVFVWLEFNCTALFDIISHIAKHGAFHVGASVTWRQLLSPTLLTAVQLRLRRVLLARLLRSEWHDLPPQTRHLQTARVCAATSAARPPARE